jgi:hypothetical protein
MSNVIDFKGLSKKIARFFKAIFTTDWEKILTYCDGWNYVTCVDNGHVEWCRKHTPNWEKRCRESSEALPKRNDDSTGNIVDISEGLSHKVSEVICVKCGERWLAVRPKQTLLKELECHKHHIGFVIETGEILEEE